MLTKLRQILEMIRFSHTIFALPFALLAGVMAWCTPTSDGARIEFHWQHLLGILICMVAARSAAMAFNRIVDRRIDAANPRTRSRHLPAGRLSVKSVVIFTGACCGVFIAATLLFLPNPLPLVLSVPVLAVLLGYSYAKRFTSLAHYWLGLALMLAPIAVWIAIRGEAFFVDPRDVVPALLLGLAVFFWVAGFDIIYSCQDCEFDKQTGLKSIPARFGVTGALRIASFSHLAMILVLFGLPSVSAAFGLQTSLGWVFYLGVAAVAALLLYEHSLVQADDLNKLNIAFFNVNAIVSFGLFLMGALDSMI